MALKTLEGIKEIRGFEIAHLEKAIPKKEYLELIKDKFIIHGKENNTIIFKIQYGSIRSGINGCQVDSLIETSRIMIKGLSQNVPCHEDRMAVYHLEKALIYLDKRKRDRIERGVIGKEDK